MTRATREPGNAGGSGGEHSPEEGWLWWQHSAQRSRAGPIPERGAQLESHLAGCCCALNSGVAGMGGIGIRDLAVRPPGWQEQGGGAIAVTTRRYRSCHGSRPGRASSDSDAQHRAAPRPHHLRRREEAGEGGSNTEKHGRSGLFELG